MATKPTSMSKMNLFATPDQIGPPDDVINRAPGRVLAPVSTAKPKAGKGAKAAAAATPTKPAPVAEPANDEKAVETPAEPPVEVQTPAEPVQAAVEAENAPEKVAKAKGKGAEPEHHRKPWDGQDNEIRQSFDLPVRIRTKLGLLKGFGKVTNQKNFVRDILEAAIDAELKKLEQQGVRF
jgi:hypothetical protein